MFSGDKARRRRILTSEWTKESLITWALQNNIKSVCDLEKFISVHGGPRRYTIETIFGKWSEFRKCIDKSYKPRPRRWGKNIKEYIIDIISMKGLSTERMYIELHKRDPEICPHFDSVKRHFGSWRVAYNLALRSTASGMMRLYMAKRREIGRWPTLAQCAALRIDLTKFIEIHGSKEDFDKFLEDSEKTGKK